MKHRLTIFGLAGLIAMLFSSVMMAQNESDAKDAKKTRRVKLEKIENGIKMQLDTVLAGDDVFLWNGDTIDCNKMNKHFRHDAFKKLKHLKVAVDSDENGENVMIDPGFPPMPSMPPQEMRRWRQDNRVIDLNDPAIISFRKKDLKGGLEKIEIIRKKSEGPENMNFNFRNEDELMPPIPPEAPEIIKEFKNGKPEIKIIRKEKKQEGNAGKENEEKVGPEENK